MALAGLSAAGSVAGIGSFLLDGWSVKGREKKSTKLDRLLEQTGDNLQLASDTVKQNADVLEPKVRTNVLKKVEIISIEHRKNIDRQGLAHEGKLSRAERKDYEGSVRHNVQTSNNVLLGAQVDSNLARTKLLLLEAQAAQSAYGPQFSSHSAVSPTVSFPPRGPGPAHLEPATEHELARAVNAAMENSESLQPSDDPFADPALHTSQGAASVSPEIELKSMSIQDPVETH